MDGERWLVRGRILDAARRRAPRDDAARRRAPRDDAARRLAPRDVPTGDPLGTITGLLAAEAAAAVPVLRDPCLPAEAVARVLAPVDPARGRSRAPLMALATSGSSAVPRMVVRTARSWDDSLAPFSAVTGIRSGDTVWAPGGLGSTLTLFAVWHALASGLPVVAGGRWRGVTAAGPAARQADVVQCVPVVLTDVLQAREAGLLPRLRTAVVAGAALSPVLRERARDCGLTVIEYYGAAELSFVATDSDGTGLRPFPGVEVDVRADGQVWARSPYVSLGYLDPATAGPLRCDAEGWSTVGDLGSWTPAGALTLHGRGGDVVSVGGHLVLAADVETVLGTVAGVAEVICLGEPHARLGERVVAAVRPVDGVDPVPALRAAAQAELPAPARPVRYVVLSDLPRTAGGKVARAALRDQVTRTG